MELGFKIVGYVVVATIFIRQIAEDFNLLQFSINKVREKYLFTAI